MSTDINPVSASLRSDADIVSSVVRTADLGSPVAACPGWDLRQLVEHTGSIHRWATHAIIHGGQPPKDADFSPAHDDNLARSERVRRELEELGPRLDHARARSIAAWTSLASVFGAFVTWK